MNIRAPRESTSRENEGRPQVWKPASRLPAPNPSPDWRYRWVRTRMAGEDDVTNVANKRQEGWVPVARADCPEVASLVMGTGDNIEVGGLMLCRIPEELARSREAYFSQAASNQMESVDNNFMAENDRRMPLLRPERKTEVSKSPR